jgi:hypothetical protein
VGGDRTSDAVGAKRRHAVRRAHRAMDRAAEEYEITVGWRWADAFNRRYATALIALADPAIEVHPTLFAGEQTRYDGHEGVRRWVADVVADGSPERMQVVDVRHERAGVTLIVGQIELVWVTTPLSTVLTIHDAVVQIPRSRFSDEQTVRAAGHLD